MLAIKAMNRRMNTVNAVQTENYTYRIRVFSVGILFQIGIFQKPFYGGIKRTTMFETKTNAYNFEATTLT